MGQAIILFLVRHGEAENNVRFVLNSGSSITDPTGPAGRKEYPLTERGREQVAKTAQQLQAVAADVLYSSPILRAKQTAEIIALATRLPIIFDERLGEVGFGVFNGKLQKDLLKKYPVPEMRLATDPQDHMESFLQVRSRLNDFLESLKEKYAGKKVIIVSHGDPLEQLYGILTHVGPGLAAESWYPEKGVAKKVVWESEA